MSTETNDEDGPFVIDKGMRAYIASQQLAAVIHGHYFADKSQEIQVNIAVEYADALIARLEEK